MLELGGSDPFIVMPSADLRGGRVAAVAAVHQQRPVLHRGQAVHRARGRLRRVRAAVRGRDGGAEVGDPMDEATDVGPLADASRLRRRGGAGRGRGRQGRQGAVRRRRHRRARLVLRADRAGRDHRGHARPPGGGVRPGRHAATGSPTSTRRSGSPTTPRSGSAPTPGPATRRSGPASSRDLAAGQVFINGMTSPPTRGCRSAGSSAPATAGSCPPTASGSSATSRRSGSASKRVRRPALPPGGPGPALPLCL